MVKEIDKYNIEYAIIIIIIGKDPCRDPFISDGQIGARSEECQLELSLDLVIQLNTISTLCRFYLFDFLYQKR